MSGQERTHSDPWNQDTRTSSISLQGEAGQQRDP